MKNRNKDENWDAVSWLLVKSFQHRHDSLETVLYRYGFDEHFQKFSIRGRGRAPTIQELSLVPAYSKSFPISMAKKSDLLELCKKLAILQEFHPWYANLQTLDALRHSAPEPAAEHTDEWSR
ncbi:hypothetical protein RRG08_061575 [Elysia crispata]|uniref:Uncharacterized protein n=1 Tax=Elysia crispata TaxID=231223 RepID=A0AAE0YT15_9GAST|nr:hypothetical protein RRG08_061575 [Elysia crispata]